MKKLIILIALVAAAFYAGWPAYSLYQISNSIQDKDETLLESKVAWVPLRDSLREPVSERVKREISSQSSGKGIEGALAGELGKQLTPQIVNQILDAYVTPKGVIKLAEQGGNIDVGSLGIGGFLDAGGDTAGNDEGGMGGLFGKIKDIAKKIPGGEEIISSTIGKYSKDFSDNLKNTVEKPSASDKKTAYGLGNIHSFTFTGPLSFEVALTKESNAKDPDVTAGMSFVDGDWKLSKLVPKL